MKTIGLITEYNPFHNGHKYHIEEAKRMTGADYIIAVMSGSFVQRGTPAIMDKYSRTAMALRNGIDLVLELPVCYATGSAEYFAQGAVALLDQLGVVDAICFGSEAGDISLLSKAADLLLTAPDALEDRLQEQLKEGLSYPVARVRALEHTLMQNGSSDAAILTDILAEPNNILGIEYLKALKKLSSSMEPVTIQRIQAHYHDPVLSSSSESGAGQANHPVISSATALRNAIHGICETPGDALREALESVPSDVAEYLSDNFQKTYPMTVEDFASIIKYKLLEEDCTSLTEYQDISPDLAKRLKNYRNYPGSIAEYTLKIKTKNMTLTRINRALIHLLLNIKTEDIKELQAHGYVPYARVLGIRKESSRLLKQIENYGNIPVITKVSRGKQQLDEIGLKLLTKDIFASHLYNQAVYDKYGTALENEYQHGILIL
jgi:predicted nucleotidyltransferase